MHLRVCHFRRNHVIPGNFNHLLSMRPIGHDFNARLDYSHKYSQLTVISSEKAVFLMKQRYACLRAVVPRSSSNSLAMTGLLQK